MPPLSMVTGPGIETGAESVVVATVVPLSGFVLSTVTAVLSRTESAIPGGVSAAWALVSGGGSESVATGAWLGRITK
jgi:hypothetical protein